MIRTVSGLGSLTRLSLESPLSRRTVGAVDFFLALAAAAATAASVSAADDDACCCARRATGDDDDAAAILCARGTFELGLCFNRSVSSIVEISHFTIAIDFMCRKSST